MEKLKNTTKTIFLLVLGTTIITNVLTKTIKVVLII